MNQLCAKQLLDESGFNSEEILKNWHEDRTIFLDVGLSADAHQSEVMLRLNPNSIVIGFEPLSENIHKIRKGLSSHSIILDPKRIARNFFIVPCAISNIPLPEYQTFFVTKLDRGCSSLHAPTTFELERTEAVPVFSLLDFLKELPLSRIGYIDYLKIDTQGSDIEVVQSAGSALVQILAITVELSIDQYQGIHNSTRTFLRFFGSKGFLPVTLGKNYPKISRLLKMLFRAFCKVRGLKIQIESVDPTFINVGLFLKTANRDFEIVID
jgi:FkbM family methyltransferase